MGKGESASAERMKLHRAVIHERVEAIKELVDQGADVNAVDRLGRTALHVAAMEGMMSRVKALVEVGADPQMRDEHGRSAEDLARQRGHREIAEVIRASAGRGRALSK